MFGSKKKEPKKPDRFIKILRENPIGGIYTIVMVDTVTGVNYLVVEEDQTSGGFEGRGVGLGVTLLVDAIGNPVVTPKDELETLIEENK